VIGIAVLLLVIVAVFTVAVLTGNSDVTTLSVFGAQVPVTLAGTYLTGAGAMLVLILAAGLLRFGLRRRRVQRRQRRELEQAAAARPSGGARAAGATAVSVTEDRPASDAGPRPTGAPLVGPETPEAERQALRDEAEELTGERDDR